MPSALRPFALGTIIVALASNAFAEQDGEPLITYDWPTAPGEAVRSDKYAVTVRCGDTVKTVEVLMSSGWTDPGGGPDVFRGRTFSWASFAASFDQPVSIEVQKLFGSGTQEIEVFPSGYDIVSTPSLDGLGVSFDLDRSRYLSVNYKSDDNRHTPDGVVRHMLMLFADKPEENPPSMTDPATHVVSAATTAADIAGAGTVYFPPGFHDLTTQLPNGLMELRSGLEVYLAGGAFVVGKFISPQTVDDCTIHGRGALSGRAWEWAPGNEPSLIDASGNRNRVEGVHTFDTDFHGVVPGHSATVRNVKMWGWHYNNDGFRPWGGTVEHCFLRPADDAFYVGGQPVTVTDTVIWQSFNGAIVTCGWGSEGNPYDTTDFTMRDCHILYPEWNGIGNNNGILASQLPYAASSDNIHFENIRVDGNVCAITNLKRNEAQGKTGTPGGISNVRFKNLTITGEQLSYNYDRSVVSSSKSRIHGEDGFTIQDVHFDNVSINGNFVTEQNWPDSFTIDPATTSNITFTSGSVIEKVGLSEITLSSARAGVYLSGTAENVVDLKLFWGEQDHGESSVGWPHSTELAGAQGGRYHSALVENLPSYRRTFFRWSLSDATGTSWTAARSFQPFEPSGGHGPDGLPGCLLWLDPASVVTVHQDGMRYVENWLDRTSGASATPPDLSHRPQYLLDAMNGRPAVHFDGTDAIGVGSLRTTPGAGIAYVFSQCLANPSTESWPRLLTAAPDGGVPWISPGWQLVAPASSSSGGTLYSPGLATLTLSNATIENTTIGARPDSLQAFRGDIGAVLIFESALTTSQERALDWYLDESFGAGRDIDADGLTDSWEILHFGGTGITTASSDSDGDLLNNAGELLWGFDPNDSSESLPLFRQFIKPPSGFALRWLAREGRRYEVLRSEAPGSSATWNAVPGLEQLTGFDGWLEVPVSGLPGSTRTFYRIGVYWP